MIPEEFQFDDIKDYLYKSVDLLIVGDTTSEARSTFFFNEWKNIAKEILVINNIEENGIIFYDSVKYSYFSGDTLNCSAEIDFTVGLPSILRGIGIDRKNILIDISSLNHIQIIFLTKILLCEVVPKLLFAGYIDPENYKTAKENPLSLIDKTMGIKGVPGFSKREKENQVLCPFLGFDGMRLRGILESGDTYDDIIPIVPFPSYVSHWYNVVTWNCMEILQGYSKELIVYKCYSSSIFHTLSLLDKILPTDKNIVFAPFGTRPHTMACAIYASYHENVRIIYDYAIESKNRTDGISKITIYNLTPFLST